MTTAYIVLGLCVLAGAWVPINWQIFPMLWMYLAVAGMAGLAAGGLAPRELPWQFAWPMLIAFAWAAFGFAAVTLIPTPAVLRYLVYPLAASVGVGAGLAAWRMPMRRYRWRFAPLVMGVAAVVGFFFLAGPLTRWSTSMPRQVPAFTMQLLDGSNVHSTDLAGKTVVLAFWATWCTPCREELPRLNALYEAHYASRPDVVFYVVDEGLGAETPEKAKAFLAHFGVKIPAAFDTGGELGEKLDTRGVLPVRVLIGPEGRIRFTDFGYATEDANFAALRKAIAVSVHAR
ncbi:MAG: TlpA family protein disulfide reductase [Gammaproteobacteria bacterium]